MLKFATNVRQELSEGVLYADRYRLERELGHGGVGSVWSATRVATGERVALKLLRETADSTAALEARQRFVREARAIGAVRHPNVIRVHEVIEAVGAPLAIVMDLLEGETLGQRLAREKRLEVKTAAELLAPVCAAVGAAHAAGIVHRDLKPDNIFICKDTAPCDGVRVLDFGLAKLTAVEGPAARSAAPTGSGAILGTPYYMSPEQVFGENDVDHRADIWSFGVLLYECVAGVRPTEAPNVGQIFKRITNGPLRPLRELLPEMPRELGDLVDRTLSVERAQRPADFDEVRAVLVASARSAARSNTSGAWSKAAGRSTPRRLGWRWPVLTIGVAVAAPLGARWLSPAPAVDGAIVASAPASDVRHPAAPAVTAAVTVDPSGSTPAASSSVVARLGSPRPATARTTRVPASRSLVAPPNRPATSASTQLPASRSSLRDLFPDPN